jgi:hypothetical protein
MTVRAKFRCNTVEQATPAPVEVERYAGDGKPPTTVSTWARTYRFTPQYDTSVPEDQRYALATPSGELVLRVDNPVVTFEPGAQYYLDFTPVEVAP